ncbi:hypothetical protein J8281_17980 [Aquimarina sp. U1-2]|uniref:hypothetical protein n=1 Tax=Aquimarina sp. U1-2 TaxID=2823141 RepID=UPI001AECE733|nr:hypothetical protein [Aquimarina sp. U1-2]MBP2834091.1 hypothetical protein [Aquimarina sp. U1-2]
MIHRINSNNTITLARALLATGIIITLLFNTMSDLFPEHHILEIKDNASGLMKLNYFLWFENLSIPYYFSIVSLIIAICGFFPRYLSIVQSWVTYSVFHTMLIVEGGDQISVILSLLMIPVCILDTRSNGWKMIRTKVKPDHRKGFWYYNAKCALLFIAVQMAVLYLNAGISKIFAAEWDSGTAVYYWFYDTTFGAPIWVKNSIGFLFTNKYSVSFINWGVIFLELSLFITLFLKQDKKYIFFILGIIFHFFIILIHGLPTFFLAMSAGLILYCFRLDKSIQENLNFIKISFTQLKKQI